MNILYFSNGYAREVMGTRTSVFNEMKKRGHKMIWRTYKDFFEVKTCCNSQQRIGLNFKKIITNQNIQQVWIAFPDTLPKDLTEYCRQKGIIIIGFGFDDPHDPYKHCKNRLPLLDIYITNSIYTYKEYKDKKPCIYNPIAADFTFHKYDKRDKTIFASFIGTAWHKAFKDKKLRMDYCRYLLNNGIDLKIFGRSDRWKIFDKSIRPIKGEEFLEVIYSSRIGVDIREDHHPITHRTMEYSACGTPVVTNYSEELAYHFEIGKEVITYKDKEELLDILKYYSSHVLDLEKIGYAAYKRCYKDHDITNRIDHIEKRLNYILGEKLF